MSVSAEVSEVMQQVRKRVVLQIGVAENEEQAAKTLESIETVDSVTEGDGFLVVTLNEGERDYSDISTTLIEAGLKVTRFSEEEVNLESAFMALTKGLGQNF